MPILKLPTRIITIISNKIDSMFNIVKSKFLGAHGLDKPMLSPHNRLLSLIGMYESASRHEGGIPDTQTLGALVNTSKNYLEALKLKTINKIVKDLESHLSENPQTSPVEIESRLRESWQEVSNNLKTIIESETQAAKNIAILDGIVRTNAMAGEDDPIIYWTIIRDNVTCEECIRLHTIDGVTPRLWKLSEVEHGYIKRGSDVPSILNPHPNCRCLVSTLLPGYGFGKSGKIKFFGKDHDELKKQRE